MSDAETVVLVHGLWMKGLELIPLQRRLNARGFRVRRFSYPSLRGTVAENAARLVEYVDSLGVSTVHLVGHSLGGLVVLRALTQDPGLPPGRVVLMASPVNGSGLARYLAEQAWARWYLGHSIVQGLLGDGPPWRIRRDVGVLAGTLSVGPGRLLGHIGCPNDGTVAVAETRLKGAADQATVHTTHMGLVLVRQSAALVANFLCDGQFGPQGWGAPDDKD